MNRRQFAICTASSVAVTALGMRSGSAYIGNPQFVAQRKIPKTGELLPVIGLGTYRVFDTDLSGEVASRLQLVVSKFFAHGGRLLDSSPMYGRAESVTGTLLANHRNAFRASKVWTKGKQPGIESVERSATLMGGKVDLAQVHNLLDWKTHLPVLRDMRSAGSIRYVGVTDYRVSAFRTIEKIIKTQNIDFVQIPYSVSKPQAEKRLLDVCAAHNVAVIVLSPFEQGALFRKYGKRKIPPWMQTELSCFSWAQVFLKWILGHPSVTCPIPATSNPKHLEDNMSAGRGRFPTDAERRRIRAALR